MRIRTRTLTVVFTDMVNYTRTVSGSDREGLRNLLALHEQRVGPILRGRRGRIVKNIGDSFMALFESATDAVRACPDLMESNPVGEGAEVAFRASVATGDVEETDTDAFGETCNLS
ncbi:MAG TPA: adenylate/guanylate cyclase domain-containing protein, partial [Myxococcota bacterium]|nr:adenylate/guanylate cyclase domain-containing protein [Myxococcota bacterium]